MHKIGIAQIMETDNAENEVENGGAILDILMAFDRTGGLEAGEGEGVDQLFERYAVLQGLGGEHGKTIEDAAIGRAFFVHVDENFAKRSIGVFARAQEELVTFDGQLLHEAAAAGGKAPANRRWRNVGTGRHG